MLYKSWFIGWFNYFYFFNFFFFIIIVVILYILIVLISSHVRRHFESKFGCSFFVFTAEWIKLKLLLSLPLLEISLRVFVKIQYGKSRTLWRESNGGTKRNGETEQNKQEKSARCCVCFVDVVFWLGLN